MTNTKTRTMGKKIKTDKHEPALYALQWVLAERLKHSVSWCNVTVVTHDPDEDYRYGAFEIRWIVPTNQDPKHKGDFQSKVLPLTKRTLNAEIRRQMKKLIEEEDGEYGVG